MLNEIMQNEELRKRRLTDLYEEGIIQLGDEIPYKHRNEAYLSRSERNGSLNEGIFTEIIKAKWQAIGVEEIEGEKSLKLIAKDSVYSIGIGGAAGCIYGIEELDIISGLFATGRGALKGRSVRMEDVNKLLGVVIDENEGKVYQAGNDDILSDIIIETFDLRGEGYTPESFLRKEYSNKTVTCISYHYDIMKKRMQKQKLEKAEEIVFRQLEKYWLASPGAYIEGKGIENYEHVYFGLKYAGSLSAGYIEKLFHSNSSSRHDGNDSSIYGVRPVLYLKSDCTLNTLLKESCESDKETLQIFFTKLEKKRKERQRICEEEREIMSKINELI